MIEQMDKDVHLKKLEIKVIHGAISSIRVTLSNGQISPYFENPKAKHSKIESLDFYKENPIRAVTAFEYVGGVMQICALKFLDSSGSMLEFKPEGHQLAGHN